MAKLKAVHVLPRAQAVPLILTDALASAELGIALAVTAMVGVVVVFEMLGVSHDGHVPAVTELTLPPPPPETATQVPEKGER